MRQAASASRSATIRDVATRAGVSTATVSRALRGGVGVEPATRQRVEAAARELRYRPSGVARSLKLRATQTIGLSVTDIENPFFPQVVRAVEDAARLRDYSVILADGRRDAEREIQSLEVLAGRQVDGMVIASTAITERHRTWIEERPCPVVIVNSIAVAAGVPAVLSDNAGGARMVVEHLLELGHRHIVYIGVPSSINVAVEERLTGIRAVIREHHGAIAVVEGDGSVEGGASAAQCALAERPGTTALVCYNDLTAVGAMRGLRAAGLHVPQDVSVAGFDDIKLAPYVDPPLTTVRQATEEIGRWAVETLLDLISGENEADQGARSATAGNIGLATRIPVELVVRESTAPPAKRS